MNKQKSGGRGKDGDMFELSNFFTLVCSFDNDEQIPLDMFTACLIGDYNVVQQFINSRTDLNCRNRGGWTPLMYAAYVGRDTIVNLLLDAGAPVDTVASDKKGGMTALMLSASCGIESVSYFLLQHGANINATDNLGCTALFHAVRQGHMSVVKLLIDSGADMEIGHKTTTLSPLMQAALEGHEIIFNMLLENGADVNKKTRLGESPRTLASRYGNTTIVNVIDAYLSKHANDLRREALLGEDDEMEGSSKGIGLRAGAAGLAKMIKGDGAVKKKDTLELPESPTILSNREMTSPIDLHDYSSSETEPESAEPRHHQDDGDKKTDHPMQVASNNKQVNSSSAPGFIDTSPSPAREDGPRHIKFSRICTEPPQNAPLPNHSGHSPQNLAELLEELNLAKYYPCFEKQNVDLKAFLIFTGEDLKALGIDKLGARKRMLTAIERIAKEKRDTTTKMEVSNSGQTIAHQDGSLMEDPKLQLQRALNYTKQLSTELLKEQNSRRDLEKFFVNETIRLQKIYTEAKALEARSKEAEEVFNQSRMLLQLCAADHNVISDQQQLKRMLKSIDNQLINGAGHMIECNARIEQIKIALKSDTSQFNK